MGNNNVKIWYNGKDAFNGIAPTPFVAISNDYIDFGTKWNQVQNITLEGQLTGKYIGSKSFTLLNEAVASLYDNFKDNYKTFLIIEDGSTIYSADNTVINSINISQSSWYGILPFTIELSVYDSGLFKDYYGVVEPEDNYSFKEDASSILSLTRTISAKGINVNNNTAIQNAKLWVASRKSSTISPILFNNNSNLNNRPYLLYSSIETIDRFNGIYTWEGDYKKSLNLENPNNSILSYTLDLNSGIEDGLLTVTLNGNLEGTGITELRNEYNRLNLYDICNKVTNNIFKSTVTNRPIAQSVEEISEENKLGFKITFNNDYSNEIINNYTVDMSEDSLKCLRTANFSTEISCKYGDIETKWAKVQAYYNQEFVRLDFANIATNQEFNKEFSTKLNPKKITESITFDKFNAQIKYGAQFSDKQTSYDQNILSLTSNVSYNPSMNVNVPNTSAFTSREHNIQNLNAYNRAKIEISATVIAKMDQAISFAESEAQKEVNRIKDNYILNAKNPLLEDRLVSKNNNIKTATINETWTFEGPVTT